MKLYQDWTEDYLLSLPPGEYDWIEFKGSMLLGEPDGNKLRAELSKQLSAFANTHEGGALVLGIKERPDGSRQIDAGGISLQRRKTTTKEWLEDIIPSLTDFPIVRFDVRPLPRADENSQIADGSAIFIVNVPPSDSAPHQASDNRYYQRIAGKSRPITHRQVLDIMVRGKMYEPSRRIVVTAAAKLYSAIFNASNHVIRRALNAEGHLDPYQAARGFLQTAAARIEELRALVVLHNVTLGPQLSSDVALVLHDSERVQQKLVFLPSFLIQRKRALCLSLIHRLLSYVKSMKPFAGFERTILTFSKMTGLFLAV